MRSDESLGEGVFYPDRDKNPVRRETLRKWPEFDLF